MASNIYFIYSLIITYNAVHFACSMTTPKYENFTSDPVNLDEVNEDLFKQIYKDIDNYIKNINIVKNYLMNIKFSLEGSKGEIVTKANVFMNEVESEEYAFQIEKPTTHYNEYLCRHYSRNCSVQEDPDICSLSLLNKTDYIKSIDTFIKLLFIDFNEKLHNFDQQLKEMSIEIGTIKMFAYLKYIGHKLNDSDLFESKMDDWKNATFKELDNHQMKLLEKANELINAFKKLVIKETNFEKEILKEIKKKKLSYGCCVKQFTFEIEGLECRASPALPLPTTTPLPEILILDSKFPSAAEELDIYNDY